MVRHLPLVQAVVNHIAKRLPAHVDREDLRSVGVIGLLAASRRYDRSQQQTFEAYALLKIRGAILDELRRLDTLSRVSREKAKWVRGAVERLEQELGRAPTDGEVRRALGLNEAAYRRVKQQVRSTTLVSLDDPGPGSAGGGEGANLHELISDERQEMCYERLQREELAELVARGIGRLPERHRRVLAMYYDAGMRLSEIAEVFGVSEGRISQIHSRAIQLLRLFVRGSYAR